MQINRIIKFTFIKHKIHFHFVYNKFSYKIFRLIYAFAATYYIQSVACAPLSFWHTKENHTHTHTPVLGNKVESFGFGTEYGILYGCDFEWYTSMEQFFWCLGGHEMMKMDSVLNKNTEIHGIFLRFFRRTLNLCHLMSWVGMQTISAVWSVDTIDYLRPRIVENRTKETY